MERRVPAAKKNADSAFTLTIEVSTNNLHKTGVHIIPAGHPTLSTFYWASRSCSRFAGGHDDPLSRAAAENNNVSGYRRKGWPAGLL